ncbi:hypothetical protein LCL99_10290 [Halomonas denitrificans]|uniref:hypothetical protein n=1 Tax=Halomonas denitrificans TaxID=370769 RepID=UPI001CD69A83|nr:hypothetical protein [Halomonas denitrificans]MCA0974863.1 hypothetical protein [Halomonas denitrificans]
MAILSMSSCWQQHDEVQILQRISSLLGTETRLTPPVAAVVVVVVVVVAAIMIVGASDHRTGAGRGLRVDMMC